LGLARPLSGKFLSKTRKRYAKTIPPAAAVGLTRAINGKIILDGDLFSNKEIANWFLLRYITYNAIQKNVTRKEASNNPVAAPATKVFIPENNYLERIPPQMSFHRVDIEEEVELLSPNLDLRHVRKGQVHYP
jgi:hypothetical protein